MIRSLRSSTSSLASLWPRCLVLAAILTAAALLPSATVWSQSQVLPQDVNAWLDALEGDDPLAAERAAQQLAVANAYQAVPRLIEIYATSDTPRLAAIALGGIGSAQATKVLAAALADEELTPRRNAAQIGLLYGGEAAIQTLIASLTAPQPAARRHAAEMLGYLGSPTALNGLVRAAHQDVNVSVRQSAVWALAQIDATRVRPTLAEIAVHDPDPDVRAEAERALQRLSMRGQ